MRIEFLHHLWADLWGYYWGPCPNCGRMFGGHEVGNRLYRTRWSHYGLPTCSNRECVEEVEATNARVLLHAD